MDRNFHYETVSEAIEQLRQQGFTVDFNLEKEHLICDIDKFEADEFEIVDTFRYEGMTDPADEATVYAIESKSGLKGILVTGYGPTSDNDASTEILNKLHNRPA